MLTIGVYDWVSVSNNILYNTWYDIHPLKIINTF